MPKDTKFKPGFSGNPSGRPLKGRTITDLLNKKLNKEAFCKKLIDLAAGGEGIERSVQLRAMQLIMGYIDGLPVQRTETSNESIEVRVVYVQSNRIETTGAASSAANGIERIKTAFRPEGWETLRQVDAGPPRVDE